MGKSGKTTKGIRRFAKWHYQTIDKVTNRQCTYFAIITLVIGTGLSAIYEYPHAFELQILLISSALIAMHAMRGYMGELHSIESLMVTDPKLSVLVKKNTRLSYSIWPYLITIASTSAYLFNFFMLGYLKLNLIGIYALTLILIALTLSMLAYCQYVILIIYLYRLSKIKTSNFNHFLPSETDWLKALAKLGKNKGYYFFMVGFLYTLAYVLLIPENAIQIDATAKILDTSFNLNTGHDDVFVFSWMVIFVLIVFAVPVSFQLQKYFIKQTVIRMKEDSSRELSQLMGITYETNTLQMERQTKFFSLIQDLLKSPDYPLKERSYLPVIMSGLSAVVHVLKIADSLPE